MWGKQKLNLIHRLTEFLLCEFITSILQCTYFILIISVQMMTDLEEMERCQDHVDLANYA